MERSGHPVRNRLHGSLSGLSERLSNDQELQQNIETWKRAALERTDLRAWLHRQIERIADRLSGDGSNRDWLANQLSTFATYLEESPDDRQGINNALAKSAGFGTDQLLELAPKLLQEQFERNLPAEHLVDFVRERVGADLQIVRINGTIVGALVGLVLAGVIALVA